MNDASTNASITTVEPMMFDYYFDPLQSMMDWAYAAKPKRKYKLKYYPLE